MTNQLKLDSPYMEELASLELSPEDAVCIMEAVMENGFRILPVCMWKHKMELEESSRSRERVQDEIVSEVLDEVLDVDTVDDYVKSRVRYVQKFRSIVDRMESETDLGTSAFNPMQERADEIIRAVESEGGIPEGGAMDTVTTLRSLRREGRFHRENSDPEIFSNEEANEATDKVIEVTAKMLDEGQKSIFWPGRYEVQRFISAQNDLSLLDGDKDGERGLGATIWQGLKGAVAGGIGAAGAGAKLGSRFGLIKGAAAGAVAGFVAGATVETIEQLRERLSRN